MTSYQTIDIQRLRNAVILGIERYGWIKTNVLQQQSVEFLKYVLPRTNKEAVLNLAIEIAALDHEKNIQGNKYHLFSLPHSIESTVSTQALLIDDFDFMKELEIFSGGIAIESKSGPVLVGSANEMNDATIFRIIARHYYEAFKRDIKTYPFLA